jgi:hypothetical protein
MPEKLKTKTQKDERPRKMRKCSLEGCAMPYDSKDLCTKHYKMQWDKVNKDKRRLRNKLYQDKHKERIKESNKSIYRRFNRAKNQARYRSLTFTLTQNEYSQTVSKPCFYCEGPLPAFGYGLDRIDNTKGYTPDNVIPCCTDCNRGRGARYTVEEFKVMIDALMTYRADKDKKGAA